MSNLELIQKITEGTEATTNVTIKVNGEEEEFIIRPLTAGELSKLQTIEKKGFKMKVGVSGGKRTSVQSNMTDVDVNAGEFNQYQNEALFKAVAWCLSVDGETVTPEQVERFPTGLPEQLFKEIVRISQLTDNDLTILKQFRKD